MKDTLRLKKLVIAAVLIALGLVLPFLTGQIQSIARFISPMHIPALIAGLTLGPVFGGAVGFITPLLRSVLFGMPAAIIPTALAMAFELCTYGVITGILYKQFLKVPALKKASHLPAILIAMIIAMILGRCVGGAAQAIMLNLNGKGYSFEAFVASYFTGTALGALIHIIVVPAVVIALEKAKLSCINA
ncbi:MAG: ECF transporter S component [Lachnospiraceae bacterium]|nr:ECF transporter S component [Lachnospiraceae bacterium]MBR3036344.1 ECF transporter S component [Lachnospiraceae bacterium]